MRQLAGHLSKKGGNEENSSICMLRTHLGCKNCQESVYITGKVTRFMKSV